MTVIVARLSSHTKELQKFCKSSKRRLLTGSHQLILCRWLCRDIEHWTPQLHNVNPSLLCAKKFCGLVSYNFPGKSLNFLWAHVDKSAAAVVATSRGTSAVQGWHAKVALHHSSLLFSVNQLWPRLRARPLEARSLTWSYPPGEKLSLPTRQVGANCCVTGPLLSSHTPQKGAATLCNLIKQDCTGACLTRKPAFCAQLLLHRTTDRE